MKPAALQSLTPYPLWGYLRTSLVCCGKMDLMELLHDSDLDALSKELPL